MSDRTTPTTTTAPAAAEPPKGDGETFKRVNGQVLREFCTRALVAAGCSEKQAVATADVRKPAAGVGFQLPSVGCLGD